MGSLRYLLAVYCAVSRLQEHVEPWTCGVWGAGAAGQLELLQARGRAAAERHCVDARLTRAKGV